MFLALKELQHGKSRFTMIAIITILISWLVFILSGLGNGLSTLAAATMKNVDAEYVVFEEGSRASMSRSIISGDLMEQLSKQENVTGVAAMGQLTATVIRTGENQEVLKTDITIIGIEPGSFLEPELVDVESKPLSIDDNDAVIVNDTLKDEGFALGDKLTIEGSDEQFTIVGFVHNETYNHLPSVFTTLDKWRTTTFAAPGSDKGVANPVNAIMLQGKDINSDDIQANFKGTEVVTKQAAVRGMPGYIEESGTITMMLVFLLIISACILAVFFYVLTLQKTNQLGVMKALGASQSFLSKMIVSQVFFLSLGSIIVGVIITYLTALVFPAGMPFDLSTKLVIIYGLSLLAICTLSSVLSISKMKKIDPLIAIGRVE